MCRSEHRRFRRALREPQRIQRERLQCLLRRNRDTPFGRAHGFGSIGSFEEYRRRVPARNYGDLKPWIEVQRCGRAGALTGDRITHFVTTSGSTSGAKRIPFNRAFLGEFQRGVKAWMADLYSKDPDLMDGPAYWSISPPASAGAAALAEDADDSRYLGGLLGPLVARTFAVRPATARLAPMDAFDYATLLQLLRSPDLRLISVWHPSFFNRLLDKLSDYWDTLIDDVRTGRAPWDQPWLRSRGEPQRAARLAGLSPEDGVAIWPELRLISCWGDGRASEPAQDLQGRLPQARLQPKGLLATEGVITIPQMDEGDGGNPLAIRSHIYELIDREGVAHEPHEVREGRHYDIVVSAANGLWRYRLNDRVAVTGFIGRTPCLRFLGRSDGTSDHRGEKLDEAFVRAAMDRAFATAGIAPSFAMLVPDDTVSPLRYCLLLGPEAAAEPQLAQTLEEHLRTNPHYAICRQLGQLGPVTIRHVHQGAHERYLRVASSEGRDIGSVKPRALSDRTGWVGAMTDSEARPW